MRNIELKFENKQQQSLLMTPQLKQAIRLLQLNNVELNEVIAQEIIENPLLDFEDNILNTETDANNKDYLTPNNTSEPPKSDSFPEDEPDCKDAIDATSLDYQNQFDDFGSDNYVANSPSFNEEENSPTDIIEKFAENKLSLREKLTSDFNIEIKNTSERLIAQVLIDDLDEAGYFRGNIEKIAEKLSVSNQKVLEVLDILKEIADPAGLFATSLKECIYYQLKANDELDEKAELILDNLELLAERDFAKLKKITKLSDTDIAEVFKKIKQTDPKPGAGFDTNNRNIIADVIVYKAKNDEWEVRLNEASLPRVLINHNYYHQLEMQAKSKEDKKFIAEKVTSANWFVKILQQRTTNILKVAYEIVKSQQDFFEKGISGLKPMVLMDIAEKAGLHESTVSRITSNKYIATERGMFELKFFFSQRLVGAYGTKDVSALSVKQQIRAMISGEGKAILSDDSIAIALNAQGVDIARRTVAKYREAMGIPTSAIRKKLKRDFLFG